MSPTHLIPVHRVLDREPVDSVDRYVRIGGGRALDAARQADPAAIIDEVAASGLRGRGGAGFPTARKWRTVVADGPPGAVVVNGAEGEPGSFKDRALLRRNPYRIIEGALVTALAVGTDRVVIATKASFHTERRILERAVAELRQAGWLDGVDLTIALGPDAYLFGEETALLEVLEGRQPFPRVVPPYRRGLEEEDLEAGLPFAHAQAHGSEPDDDDWTRQPPVVVDNVETLANVGGIVAQGADWFRRLGTDASPGTIVCTVTGDTALHGVAEMELGVPLGTIIETIGGGPRAGRRYQAALCGVSNPLLPADRFDTPATYEDLAAAGGGLGNAGFIVFDDRADLWAVAAAASRFLAVESCGQCEPCKRDGLTIAVELAAAPTDGAAGPRTATEPDGGVRGRLADRLSTVDQGARCSLAGQQRLVVGSLLALRPDAVGPVAPAPPPGPAPEGAGWIAPLADIVEGTAVLDDRHRTKQPDWTHDDTDSGQYPAARLEDVPVEIGSERAAG